MRQVLVRLKLLQSILDKKQAALIMILNICENQESVYLSSQEDKQSFLQELGQEKQKRIDEVLYYDELFQNTFDGIKDEIVAAPAEYAEQVKLMQDSIEAVMKLDVAIRAKEEKVKAIIPLTKKQEPISKFVNKNYILDQYKSNSKNSRKGE